MYIYIYIYIYIYVYIFIYIIYIYTHASSGLLQQDFENSYSFGKIQRTVVSPIVFNT